MRQFFIISFVVINFYTNLLGVEYFFQKADVPGPANVRLSLPLVQTPFNLIPGGYPSMQQSLALSKGLYELGHLGIKNAIGHSGLNWREVGVRGFSLTFDLVVSALPGFDAWEHEEWHRAVMRRRGIDSYNGVYDMNLGASSIPVRKVQDKDLIALKRNHPLDMIRLPAAGVEGELELVTAMEKDSFFFDTNLHQSYFYLFNYLGVISYIESGANSMVNDMHKEANEDEDEMSDRDFVGHDFNSWVYDLFRPSEPYEDRGIHPKGNGIRRYRDTSDLTAQERAYLNLQGRLTFLNLLDPFAAASLNRIQLDNGSSFNVSVRHQLTSFGYVIDNNVFLRRDPFKLFVRIHSYFNYKSYFPGIELEVIEHPLPSLTQGTTFNVRLGGWSQPQNQVFKTSTGQLGGLVGLRLNQRIVNQFQVYAEVLAKSQGWLAGNEYLEKNVTSSLGILQTL